MTPLSDYLKTVDDPTLLTLNAFYQDIIAFQRKTSTFAARLALELAELDAAHADEATRRAKLDPVERGKGDNAALYGALDNGISRTKFILDRSAQINLLLTKIRAGVNDLREGQDALRVLAAKPRPPVK